MRSKTLCATASALLVLAPAALLAQAEIALIPFESVPGDTAFAVGAGEPIELQADTEVAGDLSATGEIASDTGFRYPDGSVQVSAGVGGQGVTANSGFYSNTIVDFSPPNAFTEVCFKAGSVSFDIHASGESTTGGNCLPGDTGWVLERFERPVDSWTAARAACRLDDMRLPEPFEWQFSCENSGLFALDDMADGWEWASNTSLQLLNSNGVPTVVATMAGNGGCKFLSTGLIGDSNGVSIAIEIRCAR